MDISPVVFIVDDDKSVAESMARLLRIEGFKVRTYNSASEFLVHHEPGLPGCLITDLIMPEMSGLDLQRALLTQGCTRPIVFVTGRGDISTTVMGMRAGAVTFLAKPARRAELIATVREAIDKDFNARQASHERERVSQLLETLTPREHQVLRLVVTGMLNKQIAAELGAAEKTIKVHRGRLMDKMQVRSAAALAQLLASHKLDSYDSSASVRMVDEHHHA
jgi:RNA polymerase sigma factor (sigma-70 family)